MVVEERPLMNLTALLSGIADIENGEVVHKRVQVYRTNRCKAYIYSRETNHHMPHFHVRCTDGTECTFDFTGEILAGEINRRDSRIVRNWVLTSSGKKELEKTWINLHGSD